MDLRETLQQSLGPGLPIERELGGGGMSRVFVVLDTTLGRRMVVKVLPHELAASVSTARFNREVALAARLQHPHIVPLLSASDAGGVPYFTMPFVDGETLRDRLRRQGELPVSEAVRILREIASALAYAHEHGVVHRDIKPDNVLLSGGSAMVADFGIAKALSDSSENAGPESTTSVGVALGTPAYMSPEQAVGDPGVDHRADIYAFGVLAYEVLTAETPFAGRSMQGQLAANIAEKPEAIERRRPALPQTLATLVMRCLEKRPADRPQTAADVVRALDEVKVTSEEPSNEIQPLNLMAALESTTVVARSEYYRNRGLAVLAIVGLAIVGAGLYAWRNASHTQAVATASAPKSIAVLPLENVGGDTALQYFADGITDELTSTVSRLPGVQVTSRSATAAAVKADGRDGKKIGDRLHVGALLEGRMRRVGDRMRLTMSLTNVSSGVILWSDTYENEVKDAFAVQDSVARAVAGALRVTLGVNQQLASRGTMSARAHDLYLRGRFVQSRYTEPDLRKSLELFEAALADDPNYVMAWSGIADSWGRLSDDFVRPSEALPRMRDALARGLAIDSTVPELRFTRGAVEYFFDHDPLGAQRDMATALTANPDLDFATNLYPQVLWTNALRDSAGAFLTHAIDRDPTSPEKLFDAWQFAQKNGNAREARDYCGRLREIGMSETCEALQDLDVGRADAALKIADRARQQPTFKTPHADLAYVTALVAARRTDEAKKIVADLDARATAPGPYLREDDIALMHGLLGDNDGAITWYERALASHSSGIGALYWRTMDNPIRKERRLLALAKRAGLPSPPPYWP
jgi:TolB-like protein/tetratricopeptide (TPR) repeat protein